MALVVIILFTFATNLLKFIISAFKKIARLIELRNLRNKKAKPVPYTSQTYDITILADEQS